MRGDDRFRLGNWDRANGIKSSLSARLILVGGAAADADPTDMRRTPMVASQMQLLARARENAESKGNAADPRSRDHAVDQQRPRSCAGARPRPPPPPDDGLLARARENAESKGNAADPRSCDHAVDQQRPRSCAGARPRPPPPPDDGLLARTRENAESKGNAADPRSRDRAVDQQLPRNTRRRRSPIAAATG